MPEDVDEVVSDLLDGVTPENGPRRIRSMHRLDDGVFTLDFGDATHSFEVAVTRVPRQRWRPEEPARIGTVGGLDVDLVGVDVDNFVHVLLEAAPSQARDRLGRGYDAAFERWTATATDSRSDPPEMPARPLVEIAVGVRDDAGTEYDRHGARFGGSGTEWEARQSFLPRPPVSASGLELTLQAPGQPPVTIRVVPQSM